MSIIFYIMKTYICQTEEAMAPHSSTLAWKIPWTEEPGGLQSMGSLRVGHDWATSLSLFTFMHWRRKWQPTPVFLPGESQGQWILVGCRLWGRTVGHNWSDLVAAAAYMSKYINSHRLLYSIGLKPHWGLQITSYPLGKKNNQWQLGYWLQIIYMKLPI